ncbi:MAG: recombinase family protein [Christensenellales bacterium]
MIDTKLNKTAIYCRLSQDDGMVGDSSSIHTQKMMLEQFAKNNNFIIFDIYVDDGYSGLNFNRPGFQRMLQDIDNDKIDIVITKDLSRLGRDYIMTGYYTEIYFQNIM